jgi:hypothetical protein
LRRKFKTFAILNQVSAAASAPQKLLIRLLALASLVLACRDHCPDISATLTTTAFDRSSSRWLGISDLIAEPEGPSFISRTVTHRRVDKRCS